MRWRAFTAVAGCLLVAACGSSANHPDAVVAPPRPGDLAATQPYLQVESASDAYLIWPSGTAWLVLHTADGFRSVTNRTPLAVDTGGGLVADFADEDAAVAVGPTERLYRSPLVTARGQRPWLPSELPGAVVNGQGAVSLRKARDATLPVAVITRANGSVLQRTASGWRTLTSGRKLSPSGSLRLNSISWLDSRVAVVAGAITGRDGNTPVAFRTGDGGTTWRPLTGLPGNAIAALAPCRTKGDAVLPVLLRPGGEVMLRSSDAGATWSTGRRFDAASLPAWGCSAAAVWTAARTSGGTSVLVSTDAGRTWRTAGTAPSGLTALAPVSSGNGFAATGGSSPTLYAVSGAARRFRPIRLPGWVATIGQQMGTS